MIHFILHRGVRPRWNRSTPSAGVQKTGLGCVRDTMSADLVDVGIAAAASSTWLLRQHAFHFVVRTRDDVRRRQAVAHTLAGIGTGPHRGVDAPVSPRTNTVT